MTDENDTPGGPGGDVAGVDVAAVSAWLGERLPGLAMPLQVALISGGHSNLTYRVTDQAGRALVLRRPPLGHVLESAHDMGREYRIIAALAESPVPVAGTIDLCQDVAINGAPFYVMEHVDGEVMHDSAVTAGWDQATRRAVGEHIVAVLIKLHQVDVEAVGLGNLGRREDYLSRQLRRWVRQWDESRTHDVQEMSMATRILKERMPAQVGFAIVHGDYRPGNLMAANGQLAAVLDWELCTLGDPLADVGYLLNAWHEPGDAELTGTGDGAPTAVGGFPTRAEVAGQYAAGTGRDLGEINYYRAFAHWRLAAIGQGVYKRYLVGAMGDNSGVDLERQKQAVGERASAALELLS